MTLPELPENVMCHIPDYCTGITCCMYLKEVRTSVNFRFELNTCEYTLNLGIEKLGKNISLLDYTWGNKMLTDFPLQIL